MADLEKHAIKRDRRFVLRLVLLLTIALLAGLFVYGKMTSTDFANCAAGLHPDSSTTAPAAPAAGPNAPNNP